MRRYVIVVLVLGCGEVQKLSDTGMTGGSTSTGFAPTTTEDPDDGSTSSGPPGTTSHGDTLPFTSSGPEGTSGGSTSSGSSSSSSGTTRGVACPDAVVIADDQTLTDLSTLVTIDVVEACDPGFVVVTDDADEVLGATAIGVGTNTDVEVGLVRPLADGETVRAALREEIDLPVRRPVDDLFVVTIPAGTPAIRHSISALGSIGYTWDGVEPATYNDFHEATVGPGDEDQPIALNPGWRYEVVSLVWDIHPFEFIAPVSPGIDVVHLSMEPGNDGLLEADPEVDWAENDAQFLFTVDDDFAANVAMYRCSTHPAAMRGSVVFF